MTWWWLRVLAPLLLTGLGAWAGFLLTHESTWTAWSALGIALGALLGSGVAVAWDTWRGQRILRWLRERPDAPLPIAAGLWGEAGYRIQKALRERDRLVADEREQRARFLSAIDASPNGVTLLDAAGGIVWCNATASDHFAIDPVRDRAQRITNLVRDPAFFAALAAGPADETVTFPDPRRARRLALIVRDYGAGLRMLLSQDVTATERQEAMRRHFVANVSHEVRTPLTVLAGSLETLMSLPLAEAERAKLLEAMKQQTDRMQSLVDDLLALARLEGSPPPTPDHWFDLDPAWDRIRSDARALSAGRQVVAFDVQSGTRLAGDEKEWLSLVTNLVGNAIRYTPQGGRIDVRWSIHDHGFGELVVRDTGIGIPRELIPRITERFYRVDGSRSRETGGTGLGLSIVKHVAQRLGAELVIESELGKGSSFLVRLPAARVRSDANLLELQSGSRAESDSAYTAGNTSGSASGGAIVKP